MNPTTRRGRAIVVVACWLVAAGFLVLLQWRRVTPTAFIDELVYGKLAQSFAWGQGYSYEGAAVTGYKTLYPILISPAWALFSGATAYRAALIFNALSMSAAILPAYAIARRVAGFRTALAIGMTAGVIPSMAWSSALMTESLAYPLGTLALLCMVRAIERPTSGRTVAALAAVALAGTSRTQMLVLGPTLFAAIALDIARHGSGWRERLREHRLAVVLLGVGVVMVALLLAAGRRETVLGTYSGASQGGVGIGTLLEYMVRYVSVTMVAFALLPFTVAVALGTRRASWRESGVSELLIVATVATLLFVFAGAWASASSPPELRERYIFYPAPVVLALLPAVSGRVGWRKLSVIAGLLALYLVPVAPAITGNAGSEFVQYDLHKVLGRLDLGGVLPHLTRQINVFAIALAGMAAVATLAIARRRRVVPSLVLTTALFCIAVLSVRQIDLNNQSRSFEATWPEPPDFVDQRVRGAAAFVTTAGSSKFAGWHFELWNRRLERWWSLPGAEELNGFGQDCALGIGPHGEIRPTAAWRRAAPDPSRPCAGQPLARFLLFQDSEATVRVTNGHLLFAQGSVRLYSVGPGVVPRVRRGPPVPPQ